MTVVNITGKRILVTGVAGLVGAATAHHLLERGDTVVGVDNLNAYYSPKIKEFRLEELDPQENFTFEKLDIEDPVGVGDLFERHSFDAVINLAARAGVRWSLIDPFVYVRTNMLGTTHLLENCQRHGVKTFVLASTSSLYAGQEMPFVETLPVNEPISPYAASKKGAEAMAYTFHHLYGLDVTVLRYFTVYGPAGRPDMSVYRFIQNMQKDQPLTVSGDGKQQRDFTFIDDIATGTVAAVDASHGFEVINLGGNRPVELNHVIKLIAEELGCSPRIIHKPFHQADMKATWANTEKAGLLLDWKPTVPVEAGIARTVRWHEANRERLLDIPLP